MHRCKRAIFLPRRLLPKHMRRLPHLQSIEVAQLLVAERHKSGCSLMPFGHRNNGADIQCLGTRTLAVGKWMKLADGKRLDKGITLFEKFACLATHTCHHIHADERIGQGSSDKFDLMGKKSGVVSTAHQAQDFIGSCLQRDVEMRSETSALVCYPPNHLVGDEVRLDAAYAVAFHTLHLIKSAAEVEETLPCRTSEVTDIDTREHNLLASFGHHVTCHSDQFGNGSIATASTCQGYRAICAEIVATVLYLKEMTCAVVGRTSSMEGLNVLVLCAIDQRFVTFREVAQ